MVSPKVIVLPVARALPWKKTYALWRTVPVHEENKQKHDGAWRASHRNTRVGFIYVLYVRAVFHNAQRAFILTHTHTGRTGWHDNILPRRVLFYFPIIYSVCALVFTPCLQYILRRAEKQQH